MSAMGQFRWLRLTGSNFGLVLGPTRRKIQKGHEYPLSLFKALKGGYYLSTHNAILWGQMHEDEACRKYIEESGNIVEPTGLHLFPCGYLGCSPDGIVYTKDSSKGVLEIKCPWKHKDANIDEMIQQEHSYKKNKKGFFLTPELKLNLEHNYWYQVQAEVDVLEAK